MPVGGVSEKYVERVSRLARLGFGETEADVAYQGLLERGLPAEPFSAHDRLSAARPIAQLSRVSQGPLSVYR